MPAGVDTSSSCLDAALSLAADGVELGIAPKVEGLLRWSGFRTRSAASTHGYSRPPAKSGLANL